VPLEPASPEKPKKMRPYGQRQNVREIIRGAAQSHSSEEIREDRVQVTLTQKHSSFRVHKQQ